jgi:microcystin degradation protein MlrC
MRDQVLPPHHTIDEALDAALQEEQGPVVIADVSDNSGGGAAGDSTFMLQAMLERGIDNAAIGCIWDPIAVSVLMDAGEGAHLDLRIGGKMGPMSGDPLDLHVEVLKLTPKAIQHFGYEGAQTLVQLGDSAAVRVNGIDIVLISKRTQTFSPEVFTQVGIDPTQKHILIVKSMHHFYAGFAPIATRIIHCATPGAVAPDFKNIPFQKAAHDKWPMVDNPFA